MGASRLCYESFTCMNRAVAVALGVVVMPESPHWLVVKGRFVEAKRVIVKTSDSEEETDMRLAEMAKAADSLEQEHLPSPWHGQGVWKELLRPSSPIRQILITAIGINFFMQASGNDAFIYYSPEVFEDAGIQQVGVTIIMVGSLNVFSVLRG